MLVIVGDHTFIKLRANVTTSIKINGEIYKLFVRNETNKNVN